jgi:membrane-associated HD superfamily phosphohydrolase
MWRLPRPDKLRRGGRVAQALKINSTANDSMRQNLEALLAEVEAIRQEAGSLPYVSVQLLSLPTQIYLRQLSPEEWETPSGSRPTRGHPRPCSHPISFGRAFFGADRSSFLRSSGPSKSLSRFGSGSGWTDRPTQMAATDPYTQLIAQVEAAQQRYRAALPALEQLTPPVPATVLNLADADWQHLQTLSRRVLERLQKIGIVDGLPREVRAEGIQAQLDDLMFSGQRRPNDRSCRPWSISGCSRCSFPTWRWIPSAPSSASAPSWKKSSRF